MIERAKFFAGIRHGPFPGALTAEQVDGINRILDEWEKRGLTDLRWLAYILATAKWETAHRMQPIREMGGEAYLRSKRYYPWVGEGLVQVTWETNHKKFGATAPGQMLTWPIALRAIFDGMIKGMFTGHKLADHFNAEKTDWFNARRIVNGTDKAAEIATIAKQFYADLQSASVPAAPKPIPAPPLRPAEPAKPSPEPASGAAAGTAGGAIIAGTTMAGVYAGWGWLQWLFLAAGIGALILAGVLLYRWHKRRTAPRYGDPPQVEGRPHPVEAADRTVDRYLPESRDWGEGNPQHRAMGLAAVSQAFETPPRARQRPPASATRRKAAPQKPRTKKRATGQRRAKGKA